MAHGVMGKLSALGLVVVSTGLALLLAEGGLRLAVNPADFLHATLVQDAVLGQRIQPLTTGHDALGFRNRQVPAQANVIAHPKVLVYLTYGKTLLLLHFNVRGSQITATLPYFIVAFRLLLC